MGGGGQNKRGSWRSLLHVINGRAKINGGGRGGGGFGSCQNFKVSVNIGNEWKKRHKCLILMLNIKVSKQTRNEASKNKAIIERVSNISIN